MEAHGAALGHLWGAGEERGLFKIEDGGRTWSKILYVDEHTGNPEILYAGMWAFRRTAWNFNSGGSVSGLYKSLDGGVSWEELKTDLPEGKKGRVAIRVSPADPSYLFTIIESDQTALYRSKDKGATWEMLNQSPTIAERSFYFCLKMEGESSGTPLLPEETYIPIFTTSGFQRQTTVICMQPQTEAFM